jgi:holo-[acyl-carrier protein] synthase
MIVGVGVGLVDVPRFEAALERFGSRMRERVFTEQERAYAARRAAGAQSLAVRFAAKVAARRALGRPDLRWQELEVVRERGAAPSLRLHGRASRAAVALGVHTTTLTLSHDAAWGIGQVILEGAR